MVFKMLEMQISEIRSKIISHRNKSESKKPLFHQVVIRKEKAGYLAIFQIMENKHGTNPKVKDAVVLSKVARPDRDSGPRAFKTIETLLKEIAKTEFKGPVVFFVH